MPRGRTRPPTPDLFSEASAPEPPPTPASQVSSPKAAAVDMAVSLRRYLLPKDLPNALKQLDDGELASLLEAALDEAKRRGTLPSGLAASALDDPTPRGSFFQGAPGARCGSLADTRPSERRSCGLQGRYSAPSDCAGVRDFTIRSAEGAGLRRTAARKGKLRLRHSAMGRHLPSR